MLNDIPLTADAEVDAARIFDPFSNSILPLLYTTIPCCNQSGNCSYANCNLPSRSLAVDNLLARIPTLTLSLKSI